VTVVLMIVSHSLIDALLAARRAGDVVKDERDAAIEARADRIEGYALLSALFGGHIVKQSAIIWQYPA
jgi:hypothetical protein